MPSVRWRTGAAKGVPSYKTARARALGSAPRRPDDVGVNLHRPFPARRLPVPGGGTWVAVVLVVALMSALLLAFDHTVHRGVVQGAERRAATLERANAASQCQRMPDRQARAECRARLR